MSKIIKIIISVIVGGGFFTTQITLNGFIVSVNAAGGSGETQFLSDSVLAAIRAMQKEAAELQQTITRLTTRIAQYEGQLGNPALSQAQRAALRSSLLSAKTGRRLAARALYHLIEYGAEILSCLPFQLKPNTLRELAEIIGDPKISEALGLTKRGAKCGLGVATTKVGTQVCKATATEVIKGVTLTQAERAAVRGGVSRVLRYGSIVLRVIAPAAIAGDVFQAAVAVIDAFDERTEAGKLREYIQQIESTIVDFQIRIQYDWINYLNALAAEARRCSSPHPEGLSAKDILKLMQEKKQAMLYLENDHYLLLQKMRELVQSYNPLISQDDIFFYNDGWRTLNVGELYNNTLREWSEDAFQAVWLNNNEVIKKYIENALRGKSTCEPQTCEAPTNGGGSGSGACAVTCPPEEPFRGYEYRCCRTETGSSNTSCEGLLPNEWIDVDRTPEHRLYGQCSGGGGDTGGGAGGGTGAPTPTARPSWYTPRYAERLNALRAAMSSLSQSQLRSAVEAFLRANMSSITSVQDALRQTMRLADQARALVSEGNKHLLDIRAVYAAFAALKGERAAWAIRNVVTLKDIVALRSWLTNEREFIQLVNMLIAVPISGEGSELESIGQRIRVMIAQISESSELKIDIVLRSETALWKILDLLVRLESSLTEVDKKRLGEIAGELVSSYQRLAATAPEATLGYGDPAALAKNLEELGNLRALLEAREAELKEIAKGADAI